MLFSVRMSICNLGNPENRQAHKNSESAVRNEAMMLQEYHEPRKQLKKRWLLRMSPAEPWRHCWLTFGNILSNCINLVTVEQQGLDPLDWE